MAYYLLNKALGNLTLLRSADIPKPGRIRMNYCLAMRGGTFLVLAALGITSYSNAATPSISSISGPLSMNSSLTVSGSNFGSHNLQVEWIGSNIESGTVGADFSKSRWFNDEGWANTKYASDASHSGSKSLKCIVDGTTNYNCEFGYQLTSPVLANQTLYVTWWVRKDSQDNTGQWKMLRASGIRTIVDGPQELVLFNWNPVSGGGPSQIVVDPGQSNDQTFWPPSTMFAWGDNKWYRQELLIRTSSIGTRNGSATLSRYDGTSLSSYNTGSILTSVTSSYAYNYVIFQNYNGNGMTGSSIWFDDIYVQTTPARVELCNASTWASRTQCEIQVPTSWTNTVITFSGNRGSFQNGTAYLYVIEQTGSVNASGYPITVTTGGGTTPLPPAPTNLRVQ